MYTVLEANGKKKKKKLMVTSKFNNHVGHIPGATDFQSFEATI